MDTITEENLNDLFLGGLKDHIQHEVRMFCPNSVNESFILACKVEEKFLISRKQGANVTRDKGEVLDEGPSDKEEDDPISKEDRESSEGSHDSQPIISCHALSGFSAPQTLKVVGFLKKKKVTVLIDSGSTHNFINKKL